MISAAIPQPIVSALLQLATLSPRERQAFDLLGLGYGNRSIANELAISERTAKRYITAILAKLELESRLQAGLTALIAASVSPDQIQMARRSYGLPLGNRRH